MSKILDIIGNVFRRGSTVVTERGNFLPFSLENKMPFSRLIFFNICDLLTDLCNDVTFQAKKRADGSSVEVDTMLFAEFRAFFNAYGQLVLNRLFKDGYIVISHDVRGFRICDKDDYTTHTVDDKVIVEVKDSDKDLYVMKSPTFEVEGVSDWCLLNPFLEYLDNVLNASNTTTARLGTMVIASPKNLNGAPTATVLNDNDKKKLEEEMMKDYGALKKQRQIMLLPREMSIQTVNLAGLDQQTQDKVKLATLAIADRIKVPANQIAIIDATSSKSLSNGTELREGDFNKYQSFERLLNRTFVRFANDCGLNVNYTIYNKPIRQTTVI